MASDPGLRFFRAGRSYLVALGRRGIVVPEGIRPSAVRSLGSILAHTQGPWEPVDEAAVPPAIREAADALTRDVATP